MDEVFVNDVSNVGLAEMPQGQDCTTATGVTGWSTSTNSGLVGCGISPEGFVFIFWTDDTAVVEGAVRTPGAGQAELAALYTWWQANSDYQV